LLKNEYFVAIRNDEFWFRADGVVVNLKVIAPDNRKINKNVKWVESDSIALKKYKSLHFATINNDKLNAHFINAAFWLQDKKNNASNRK